MVSEKSGSHNSGSSCKPHRNDSVKSVKTSSTKSKHSQLAESLHSHKTSSSKSKHSSKHSSVGSCKSDKSYLDHKAEAAGLRAEASLLKRKREAELEAELLDYDQKIQRAEAMEKVYFEMQEMSNEMKKMHIKDDEQLVQGSDERKNKKQRKDEEKSKPSRLELATTKEKEKRKKERKRRRSSGNINQTLSELLHLQTAPSVEIDTFSGEVLEYHYFLETFREVVERVISNPRSRLTRLIQSLEGEPKELVRHCIYDDPEIGYDHAIELLDKQYGDPHHISSAYLTELRQWPNLKQHDAKAFRSFNSFLIKCKIYKRKGRLNELDSTDTLRCLVKKLPSSMQDKWNRRADTISVKDE